MPNRFLTVPQLCEDERLPFGRKTIEFLILSGKLRVLNIGKGKRARWVSTDAAVDELCASPDFLSLTLAQTPAPNQNRRAPKKSLSQCQADFLSQYEAKRGKWHDET